MKTLRAHLDEYLSLRRQLGFKLRTVGRLLGRFVVYAEEQKANFITQKLALAWATQPTGCQPVQWANRLGMVRRFAQYVSGSDGRTEVPPPELLPYRFERKPPYLYSGSEVSNLIKAFRQTPAPDDLRALSQATLIGLLAVTGMRVGEAIGLDRKDVDLRHGVITVRQAKFNKSRLIPVHASTQKQLCTYARQRDKMCPHPKSPSFFLSERSIRLTDCTVRRWFIIVSHQIGRRGPRIHDRRHRFAYKTILNWYRRGADVEVHLPELTTYLGHGHVADTYWYISSTPELLRLATQRLERRKGGSIA
jgi:integrase/recombinase XerD